MVKKGASGLLGGECKRQTIRVEHYKRENSVLFKEVESNSFIQKVRSANLEFIREEILKASQNGYVFISIDGDNISQYTIDCLLKQGFVVKEWRNNIKTGYTIRW